MVGGPDPQGTVAILEVRMVRPGTLGLQGNLKARESSEYRRMTRLVNYQKKTLAPGIWTLRTALSHLPTVCKVEEWDCLT